MDQNSPVLVSNESLMPHSEPHNQDSQIIQPATIPEAPQEVRDFISIPKADLGVIAEPKSKKWPVVVIVAAVLIGLFILYEYVVYRSLIAST